jgi:hypothetical protein
MVICGTLSWWYWKMVLQWYDFLVRVAERDVFSSPDLIPVAMGARAAG